MTRMNSWKGLNMKAENTEWINQRVFLSLQRRDEGLPFTAYSLLIETRPFFIATTTAWVRALALSLRNIEVI